MEAVTTEAERRPLVLRAMEVRDLARQRGKIAPPERPPIPQLRLVEDPWEGRADLQ